MEHTDPLEPADALQGNGAPAPAGAQPEPGEEQPTNRRGGTHELHEDTGQLALGTGELGPRSRRKPRKVEIYVFSPTPADGPVPRVLAAIATRLEAGLGKLHEPWQALKASPHRAAPLARYVEGGYRHARDRLTKARLAGHVVFHPWGVLVKTDDGWEQMLAYHVFEIAPRLGDLALRWVAEDGGEPVEFILTDANAFGRARKVMPPALFKSFEAGQVGVVGWSKFKQALGIALVIGVLARTGLTWNDVGPMTWRAQLGSPGDRYRLGLAYEQGTGVIKDVHQADAWLSLVAGKLKPAEALALATALDDNRADGESNEPAIRWLARAADGGSGPAAFKLAALYEAGQGTPRDEARALKLYQQAATAGVKEAYPPIVTMYQEGRGTPKDVTAMLAWCDRAFQAGDTSIYARFGQAQEQLGHRLQTFNWYQTGAAKGDLKAQFLFGQWLARDRFNPASQDASLAWYRRAAQAGSPDAQFKLGQLTEAGAVVPRDPAAALKWYEAAAAQNLPEAQIAAERLKATH